MFLICIINLRAKIGYLFKVSASSFFLTNYTIKILLMSLLGFLLVRSEFYIDSCLLAALIPIKSYSNVSAPKQCTALVIWGKNLTSSVGSGRLTKQVRNMIKLPPYQQSVITGLILSDAWLRFADKSYTNAL